MQTAEITAPRKYSLPMLYDVDTLVDRLVNTPSPTTDSPIAQTSIGEIVRQGVKVPDNVKDLLEPLENRTVEELLESLRGIVFKPCDFVHEELICTTPVHKLVNFVQLCKDRGTNAGCGHQGTAPLDYALKRRTADEDTTLDAQNLNNPLAKIQFALALVLAIGNHNAEASAMVDEAMKEARTANFTDTMAAHYHKAKARGTLEPDAAEKKLQEIRERQEGTAERVLAMRDKALKFLEDDVAKLEEPSFKRQKSGTLNSRIGRIFELDGTDSGVQKQVSAMLR